MQTINSGNKYIDKAYEWMETAVPAAFDCGFLCSKKCCSGAEQDGMYLFPGEEKLFENRDGFTVFDHNGLKTLLCTGNCKRYDRPLACRFFPLFPYAKEENGSCKVVVKTDMRAVGFCPLAPSDIALSFQRAVRIAGRVLVRDPEIAAFLKNETEKLCDFGRL